jgi:hypothetical protein
MQASTEAIGMPTLGEGSIDTWKPQGTGAPVSDFRMRSGKAFCVLHPRLSNIARSWMVAPVRVFGRKVALASRRNHRADSGSAKAPISTSLGFFN